MPCSAAFVNDFPLLGPVASMGDASASCIASDAVAFYYHKVVFEQFTWFLVILLNGLIYQARYYLYSYALPMCVQDKETLTVQILDVNQGGLICRCQSLQAFIPISQLNSKIRGRDNWLSIEVCVISRQCHLCLESHSHLRWHYFR